MPPPKAPHRKRIKHYHDPSHCHELTFSTYQRRPLLTNDSWRNLLAEAIHRALASSTRKRRAGWKRRPTSENSAARCLAISATDMSSCITTARSRTMPPEPSAARSGS